MSEDGTGMQEEVMAAAIVASEAASFIAALESTAAGGGVLRDMAPEVPKKTLPLKPPGVFSPDTPAPGPLRVQVQHGDLRFVQSPLMVGHYQALSLSGSEAIVDIVLNHRMRKALRSGLYPETIGHSHIFDNERYDVRQRRQVDLGHQVYIPRPKALVVVGLGEEGKLKSAELSYTVRLGVISYGERLFERTGQRLPFQIAATLIGSGGTGVTVGNAAQAIVQGVIDANARLHECGWPPVEELLLVEVYLDRATDAWRVLNMQAAAAPERLKVAPLMTLGQGRLRRPLDSSYRGASYDFISVLQMKGEDADHPWISYSLDSKRARTEVRAQNPQGSLVRDLVAKASNIANVDSKIGSTLFHLLVPVEIEPYLAGSSDMVIELDSNTASLPWELLDTEAVNKGVKTAMVAEPWAIRSKLIRKLQVEKFRTQIIDATAEDNVLVIGEPLCDPRKFGPLPGARNEAIAVEKVIRARIGGVPGEKVKILAERNDAQTIVNALFDCSYRAVHIAGHGMAGKHGGVVLSGNQTFLGAAEIQAMRITPELVFLNCCHLAEIDASLDAADYDRSAFAANIAMELIRVGVRCVIAAGWAVEDSAAERFATKFYTKLFEGCRFIDAVGEARRAAWLVNRQGNTWAAYQCYGDPEWSWYRDTAVPSTSVEDEYSGIASSITLVLVLEGLATVTDFSGPEVLKSNIARIDYLEKKFQNDWGHEGAVAEAFGMAYAAVQSREKALFWLKKAMHSSDGGSSWRAVETYAAQLSLPGSSELHLIEAIHILRRLLHTAPSLKRNSIMAIAYRRLSMSFADNRCDAANVALRHALKYYGDAAENVVSEDGKYRYYPVRAKLACALRFSLLWNPGAPLMLDPGEVSRVAEAIRGAVKIDPSFFSIISQSELDMITALADRSLEQKRAAILASIADLHNRMSAPRLWVHVYDDARFVLEPYIHVLPDDDREKMAAREILDILKRHSLPQ